MLYWAEIESKPGRKRRSGLGLHAILALVLFALVIGFVVWQPRGLSIGWPAAMGALLAVALGVVSWAHVVTVVGIVWDATLTFVGIILNSLLLDQIGFFEWAALHMAKSSRGSGRRLFFNAILLGALVAALFANDGAALIFTPIVYEQGRALGLTRAASLALVMSGGFIADFTSTPIVVSNLVNIVSADFFHLGFLAYAARMVPVDIMTLLAAMAMLYVIYHRALPRRVAVERLPEPKTAIRDPRLFRWSWVVLGILLAGFFVSQPLHIPVSAVVGLASLLFCVLAWRSPAVNLRRAFTEAPWKIVIFSVGMYVVVFGLKDAGLLALVAQAIRMASVQGLGAGVLVTGGLAAGLSSMMNNMPAVMMVALSIHTTGLPLSMQHTLAYANVVGSDLGPKLTPIGSLATLLWLHVLDRRGMTISWGYYIKVGIMVTIPILAVALMTLYGWTVLGGY